MPFRVWEFLVGAYVAWWPSTKISLTHKLRSYSLYILCALIFCLLALDPKPDALGTIFFGHPAIPALVVTLLTGLIIKVGIEPKIISGLVGQFFVKLGDISYSLYLVHFPIIVLFNYLPFSGTRLATDGYLKLSFAVILIGCTSIISYVFIEKKYSFGIYSLKVKNYLFITVFIIFTAFSLISFNLNQYSLAERNIFSAWTDRDTYRCGKIFRIFNPFEIICKVGDAKGEKRILLIGNSHADSIKRVFADKAIEYGISTFFVVANDPLLGGGPHAERFIDEAVKRNIKAIVIHYNNSYTNENFRNELAKLIKISILKKIKIFIIAPVPTHNVNIPQSMFNDLINKNTLSLTQKQHVENTRTFREFVAELQPSDFVVLDPAELLCSDEGGCLVSNNESKPYYFDSNHLTLTGSSSLKPLFERLFSHI